MLRYGPGRKMVKTMVWLSWPIIRWGKKLSSYPVLKWIIHPFFAYPYSEVTAVPINVKVDLPDSVPVPVRILERLVGDVEDRFLLDECICRGLLNCENHPKEIGCMALGPAIKRINPSHGRRISAEEAVSHIRKAADSGLIASLAHTWIDPLAFGLRHFNQLMFICFCDDCCCLYRTHMTKRGPNLDRSYRPLPGVSIRIDTGLCSGCGVCVERCFVASMQMEDGIAVVGDDCKSCGRCVELCPENAIELVMEDEETLYRRLRERIAAVADISAEG